MYNGGFSAERDQWSPSIDYSDRSSKKFRWILLFIFATILLVLSVAALVIVFAVQNSWFSDNFRPNTTRADATNYTNRYGLWRLCFYANETCESWFITEGASAVYIEQRLNQSRVGINAWQAVEIVYLFINASTMLIAVIALLSFLVRWRNAHYYLAILTVFCIWPAVGVGVSGLFVFGFSVFNVATAPRSLDWCFYVDIAAVALSLLAALLFTIYDLKLKSPKKKRPPEDRILTAFPDFLSYPPAQQSSSLVLVEKNQNAKPATRADAYKYVPPTPAPARPPGRVDYSFPPFPASPTSTLLTSQMPPYHPANVSFDSTMMRANGEAVNSYVQRGMYRPAYLNSTERTDDPTMMPPYLSSSQGFRPLDPSDIAFTQQPYQPRTNFY